MPTNEVTPALDSTGLSSPIEPWKMPSVTFLKVLERAREGDEDARNELVDCFYADVRQAVHRRLSLHLRRSMPRLGALFSTRDIVQDVFLSVMQELDAFEGEDEGAFRGFLATSVSNRLLDLLRHHQAARRDVRRSVTVPGSTGSEPASNDTTPATAVARIEEAAEVDDAIGMLGERDRKMVEMRFKIGSTYPEIQAALGFPTADAARKAVCAAQARLLMNLRTRGIR